MIRINFSAPLLLAILNFIVIMSTVQNINAFNLSPKPNLIIKDPQFATKFRKIRASYFGFAISLRPNGVIIGAPRAQSTIEAQRHINETGAIYKCSPISGTCAPYIFDDRGNSYYPQFVYNLNAQKRDFQWLGASIDGGTNDTDKILVCAPRFLTPSNDEYYMHGICYWINDTLSDSPLNVTRIEPLLEEPMQSRNVSPRSSYSYFYYAMAEQGISAHVTDNNEEFLIGAPGLNKWRGSLIINRKKLNNRNPIRNMDNYEAIVLLPEKWKQSENSYFGFAVGSGYFDSANRQKLMYVVTAPQANNQAGEAYIVTVDRGFNIRKHYIFGGEQFGEYFGYSVLTDDFNSDGLTDVIISAPLYSFQDSYDNGAIYVFTNRGNFIFERKILNSPLRGNVRFGTTLTRLGDINHDGYNDIAVGAPFAQNGSVFIFLGNKDGIRKRYSQRLNSPLSEQAQYGAHMFGHGLSKGSDIDKNGYNDLAIGAPNAEAVFIYKAYPVIKVDASVRSLEHGIKPEQGASFKVKACFGIESSSSAIIKPNLAISLIVDPLFKRVTFYETESNELSFNATAGIDQKCSEHVCELRFSFDNIFKPIELQMHYDVINQVPNSGDFCETCVAIDPADAKVTTNKINFITDCTDICVADLKVSSSSFTSDYVLGSSNSFKIIYNITNDGETAYLPQINITSSNNMGFAYIPSNCKVVNDIVMLCDLSRGQLRGKGAWDSITVSFDVSSISGNEMVITAEVYSTSKESNVTDNKLSDIIILKGVTEIEATGVQVNPQIDWENKKNSAEVINKYEVKNNGPSTVQSALEIVFSVPIAYKISDVTIPIVDISNITMQAIYDGQVVAIDFVDNDNNQILTEMVVLSNISSITDINQAQKLVRNDSHLHASIRGHANKEQYARIYDARSHDLLSEDFRDRLPAKSTIVFNCKDQEMTICVRATVRVYNLKPEKPINIKLHFNVDLNEINQILMEPWDFFVILIDLGITKNESNDAQSLTIVRKIEPNIITKKQLYETSIWILILAAVGGLLLLSAVTFGLYKFGFFKRTKKEELEKLVKQAQDVHENENPNSNNNKALE